MAKLKNMAGLEIMAEFWHMTELNIMAELEGIQIKAFTHQFG